MKKYILLVMSMLVVHVHAMHKVQTQPSCKKIGALAILIIIACQEVGTNMPTAAVHNRSLMQDFNDSAAVNNNSTYCLLQEKPIIHTRVEDTQLLFHGDSRIQIIGKIIALAFCASAVASFCFVP